MVGGGAESIDDLRVRAGDDRLEQLRRHAARARESSEQPARRKQLQRPEVDVLVGASRLLHLRRARRELGRVEDDEVELRVLVAQRPQLLEYVRLDELD